MKRSALSPLFLGALLAGLGVLAALPGCQGSGAANLSLGGPPAPSATPPAKPADGDGDGVDDGNDKCADKKEDGLPPDAKDGCPTEDPDQDGVLGAADKCPDKPETKNEFQDDDGCPDEKPAESAVKVTGDHIEIKEEIKFKTGTAEIDNASDKLIEEIAKAIKDNPDIDFVEVAGHTDKRGQDAANKTLSQKRAEAVVAELVKDGVDKAKLRATGYGPFCPVDKGDSEEAHAKNRRVEFDILRRGGKDLEIKWGGCEDAMKKAMKPQPLPKVAAPKADAKAADPKAAPKK